MHILFLTLEGLLAYAAEHPDREWCACSIFFLDCEPGELAGHQRVGEVIQYAERQGRVSWRRNGSPFHTHETLSKLLEGNKLEPLNPNLPPVDEPSFLKIAVERVNNKNGYQRVEVVA